LKINLINTALQFLGCTCCTWTNSNHQ